MNKFLRVGDDRGLQAHLRHRPLERRVRPRIEPADRFLPLRDASDVRLVDAGLDLHPGQVAGDGEKRRRLKAGRHGLPHIHLSCDDHPVDGRDDARVAQARLGLLQRGLGLHDLGVVLGQRGAGQGELGLRGVQLAPRDQVPRPELLVAPEGPVRVRSGRLGARHAGLGNNAVTIFNKKIFLIFNFILPFGIVSIVLFCLK